MAAISQARTPRNASGVGSGSAVLTSNAPSVRVAVHSFSWAG